MEAKLQKPHFIKLSEIKPVVHCYHVYGQIESAEHSEIIGHNGKALKIVEGVIADDTSFANYKFTGNHTALIHPGKVIAIRNGKSNIVNEHIVLELDQFGRVTEESEVTFKDLNKDKNISAIVWEKVVKTAK